MAILESNTVKYLLPDHTQIALVVYTAWPYQMHWKIKQESMILFMMNLQSMDTSKLKFSSHANTP
jgi:hypothetical protein